MELTPFVPTTGLIWLDLDLPRPTRRAPVPTAEELVGENQHNQVRWVVSENQDYICQREQNGWVPFWGRAEVEDEPDPYITVEMLGYNGHTGRYTDVPRGLEHLLDVQGPRIVAFVGPDGIRVGPIEGDCPCADCRRSRDEAT